MKRIKSFLLVLLGGMICSMQNVQAVGFDEGAANEIVSSFLDPMTAWLLGIIPGIVVIVIVAKYIQWSMTDEDEREQRPMKKFVYKTIFWGVIAEIANVLVRIFGL